MLNLPRSSLGSNKNVIGATISSMASSKRKELQTKARKTSSKTMSYSPSSKQLEQANSFLLQSLELLTELFLKPVLHQLHWLNKP